MTVEHQAEIINLESSDEILVVGSSHPCNISAERQQHGPKIWVTFIHCLCLEGVWGVVGNLGCCVMTIVQRWRQSLLLGSMMGIVLAANVRTSFRCSKFISHQSGIIWVRSEDVGLEKYSQLVGPIVIFIGRRGSLPGWRLYSGT